MTTFEHSGAFVVRAPLLPFTTVSELDTGDAAAQAWRDGEPLEQAVAADHAALTSKLHALLEDPVVREAVWLASPALDERMDAGEDLTRPLLSYVTRMSMRATPFGLFAGCAAGTVGGPTEPLTLPSRTEAKRHTRLDFAFLAAVIASLTNDPQTREVLKYVPNTGRYRAGGRLRLAEARIDESRRVRYHRVTFEEDEALAATLENAKGGATIAELAAHLVDDDITIEEATEYVGEMVSAQLLVPRLGPPVTGEEPVPGMVSALRPHTATVNIADALAEADAEINAMDDAGPGADRSRYLEMAERLRKVDPDLRTDRLFQVDLGLGGAPAALPDAVVREVRRAVDVLHRIARAPGEDELSRFRQSFVEKYEDRLVPLAEVLDEEVGLGFGPGPALSAEGAPLLAGVMGTGRAGQGQWSPQDGYLLRFLTRPEVELTDADIKALSTSSPQPLPDAVSATFTLVRDGEGFKLLLSAISGPSGARLLGRFCHVDPGIEALVRDHVEVEQSHRPDAVYAEIVHLPEGRIGNILARPVLRPYEIEFLGTSGSENTLPFEDLLVTVMGDRVVIWSRSLDREVIPRLTSAHNHVTGALAPYRFLAALQYQGVQSTLRWTWGPFENASSFLPRVSYGRLVLSRATWQPSKDDIAELQAAKTLAERYAAAQRLREKLDLPRHVVVAKGDNELPVDLDKVGGVELLAHEASRGGLRLFELYPGPDEQYAVSPEGPRSHEIVLPLVRKGTPVEGRLIAPPPAEESFPPGSEWMTLKLYCGPASADTVLREAVTPFVRSLGDFVDGWFFIRYGDPDNHLRIRFNAEPARLWGQVLPAFRNALAPALDQGLVRRVLVDTYRREVARYGGPEGVRLAEQVFRADSDFVLAVLGVAEGDSGLDVRWRLAVAGTDRLLADAGMPLEERRASVKAWRDGYVREQGDTGESAKRRSGKLFRDERASLAALLEGEASSPALQAGLAALDRRSEVAAPLLRQVPARTLNSHVHMHVNRLLRAAQRTQELVVLDLLDRLYAARIARSK